MMLLLAAVSVVVVEFINKYDVNFSLPFLRKFFSTWLIVLYDENYASL